MYGGGGACQCQAAYVKASEWCCGVCDCVFVILVQAIIFKSIQYYISVL